MLCLGNVLGTAARPVHAATVERRELGDEAPMTRVATNSVVNGVHCNQRTKDIYLGSGYPYSKLHSNMVLETLESVGYNKTRYFDKLRERLGGHPYNDNGLPEEQLREYQVKTIGEGVQLFTPETVSPDPRVKRRFICLGDSIVRETCNALAMLVAGAKAYSNHDTKVIMRPHLPNAETIQNVNFKFKDQLRATYDEAGTSVLFRWDPLFAMAGKNSATIARFFRRNRKRLNARNTRTTLILGFGMHGLFRAQTPNRLWVHAHMREIESSLVLYFNELTKLVPAQAIDVVWIGTGVNDPHVLHAVPRAQQYYFGFYEMFKVERLPIYERSLLQSLQHRFPQLAIHHMPRALHDRKYPGVRCDGMHFARTSLEEHCTGVAEVLKAYVNMILNVVESGGVRHKPDEFLPYAACPTPFYDLIDANNTQG
jgi:hypothetical protein